MANYKCKMCGGALDIAEGHTVVKCDFCGTTQTVPVFDNEKKHAYFNRANDLRLQGEFDKAASFYELIVSEFPREAEAYWGLILCKYGIEYVESKGQRIPTCHNTLYTSVFEDADYKNALRYANVVTRDLYEAEAKRIDELQRKILQISYSEDPYDIFICYKESDEHGERTQDSVLATEIYRALKSEGYKVFFARITLEGKLGTEFEPYIFSALHSARIMLHVTTSEQHSNSVWVKNEWSRYLKLLDEGKTLIPCFKGIKASELPSELRNFQGQDFDKIGAMQDLLLGVEKIFDFDRRNTPRSRFEPKDYDFDPEPAYDPEAEYNANVKELLELESFCTAIADIRRLIDFFEAHIAHAGSREYLNEAKYQFVKHVDSFADCDKALTYLSEIGDYKDAKKLVAAIEKKKADYREKYLVSQDYAVKVPYAVTVKDLNNVIVALLMADKRVQKAKPDDYDRNIIDKNHARAMDYINRSALTAVRECTLDEAVTLRGNLGEFHDNEFAIEHYDDVMSELNVRIDALQEQARLEQQKKRRNKLLHNGIAIAIAAVILFLIIFIPVNKQASYSAKKFVVKVTNKVNDTHKDSGIYAGYYYNLTFEVENRGRREITMLCGYMDINNREGKTLSSCTVKLDGSLEGKSTEKWTVQLHVEDGDNAVELWNTDFGDLQVTFRITNIHFEDGTIKDYPKTKNVIIHDYA